MLCPFLIPVPGEVVIVDKPAEEAAQVSLGRDAAEFGYVLSNFRVSQLDETKIIRADIYDPERRTIVGVALRVEGDGEIRESIHLS